MWEPVVEPLPLPLAPPTVSVKVPQQDGTTVPPPLMRSPHVSTLYDKEDVMMKFFGVSVQQALRARALLRLGVTEADVKVAERLMAERAQGDPAFAKVEWLLGYTHSQMSYQKALEVLGVSEGVVEEDRARRLGGLGVGTWASIKEVKNEAELCGGFFKRRRACSHDALGMSWTGDTGLEPTQSRLGQLEEVCQSQEKRIRQLEQQVRPTVAFLVQSLHTRPIVHCPSICQLSSKEAFHLPHKDCDWQRDE
ncbi:unnamed protein product [Discosporangium mesarthrocarpum]